MSFPITRLRRLRQSHAIRSMVQETALSPNDFVLPLFVRSGKNVRKPVASMPGHFQLSTDQIIKEVKEAKSLGIPAMILFGIPDRKDASATGAYAEQGIIQTAIREIKNRIPDMVVIADCCCCEYTSHGHCGIIKPEARSQKQEARKIKNRYDFVLDNDATLEILAKIALAQAKAGADMIAPSGMIDGMVKTIRTVLDENGFSDRLILSYSAKYASAFYAPFRQAAEGSPQFGDRKSYQMDPANAEEALRETALDLEEGADIVMVKPALSYLDIVRRVKKRFNVPVAAYNVSGEYAMVKAAAKNGWIDESKVILEILTSVKRAGADLILTYHAKEAVRLLLKRGI